MTEKQVVTVTFVPFACGCTQRVYEIPGYGLTGQKIRVRVWHTICQTCHEAQAHNYDRQPKAAWA